MSREDRKMTIVSTAMYWKWCILGGKKPEVCFSVAIHTIQRYLIFAENNALNKGLRFTDRVTRSTSDDKVM